MKAQVINIKEVFSIESPLFESTRFDYDGNPVNEVLYNFQIVAVVQTEDAQSADDVIEISLSNVTFDDKKKADELAKRIEAKGEIDVQYWHVGTCWDRFKEPQTYQQEKEEDLRNESFC
jgi:hypothetical protein